jgi:cytochrome c biogenesis protein CcmG, thiol:disulfide interchange protein DsbE
MTPPEGDILAALTAASADERPFDPATLRGKPTLVIFASPTCGFCAEELPIAARVTQTEDANMVAIYVGAQKKAALQAAKTGGYKGPVLIDEGKKLSKQYGIEGVPFTLILGPDGHARNAFRGLQDESTLRSAIVDAR